MSNTLEFDKIYSKKSPQKSIEKEKTVNPLQYNLKTTFKALPFGKFGLKKTMKNRKSMAPKKSRSPKSPIEKKSSHPVRQKPSQPARKVDEKPLTMKSYLHSISKKPFEYKRPSSREKNEENVSKILKQQIRERQTELEAMFSR